MPPAEVVEEGMEVVGETYDVVDRFCYLGDICTVLVMLSVQGGADAAVTRRVGCAWQKFRELSPFLTSN